MRGDQETIEALNEVLTAELTALNRYFSHHRTLHSWGYERTSAHKRKESIEERNDANAVIDRILYLDGIPNMQRPFPVTAGEAPKEMDLALQQDACERVNKANTLVREKRDSGTRLMLEKILEGEEHAVDWLEGQLEQISQTGEGKYLAEQIRSE